MKLFPSLLVMELTRTLHRNNSFFLPVAVELEELVERNAALLDDRKQCLRQEFVVGWPRLPEGVDKKYLKMFRKHSRQPLNQLMITDDILFWELNYYVNREKIKEKLRKPDRLKKEYEASGGQLVECECCFDVWLPQHMVYCQAFRHSFCKQCVKNQAATSLEQGKCVVSCIYGSCESSYSVQLLRKLMEPQIFETFVSRLTHFEVKQAGLEDLVACPFCDFMVIMPNAEDKVVKCLSAACRRESCRLCKQPKHLPFKCGELDATETGLRIFVENKMAEAMMRTCPNQKCNQKIIKVDGCNRMSCPCGTQMCYVCNEMLSKIDPYMHYRLSGAKCGLFTKDTELHDRRALEAGEAAMTEYLAKHPGLLQVIGGRRLDLLALIEAQKQSKNDTNV